MHVVTGSVQWLKEKVFEFPQQSDAFHEISQVGFQTGHAIGILGI